MAVRCRWRWRLTRGMLGRWTVWCCCTRIACTTSIISKFARFKEIFPGAAKTDALDARKGLELFQLRDPLPKALQVLQEVGVTAEENRVLKRLTRRVAV